MRRRHLSAALTLVVLTATTAGSACERQPIEVSPQRVTIATGSPSGIYFPLGTTLARAYTERVPGVLATAIQTGASTPNADALEAGTVDIAFALGDAAYTAYTEGTRLNSSPHRRLRSIAALYTNAFHFIVVPDSRIKSMRDLSRTRMAFGVATVTNTRSRSLDLLLEAHGVELSTVSVKSDTFDAILTALRHRTLDAALISAGYPVPAIEAAGTGVRFLNVDRRAIDRVRENYPFMFPMTIPGRTYTANAEPIETVGVDNVLLCREDLDEALVYRLTKAFFEALPLLTATHPSAGLIDADLAPATAIPLHPGAARYYRERELLLY